MIMMGKIKLTCVVMRVLNINQGREKFRDNKKKMRGGVFIKSQHSSTFIILVIIIYYKMIRSTEALRKCCISAGVLKIR